jgi:hypothetical protein
VLFAVNPLRGASTLAGFAVEPRPHAVSRHRLNGGLTLKASGNAGLGST